MSTKQPFNAELYSRAQAGPLDAVLFSRVAKAETGRVNSAAKSRGITGAALVRLVLLDWVEKNKNTKTRKVALPHDIKLDTALFVRINKELFDQVNKTAKQREITTTDLIRTAVVEWLERQGE